MTVVLDSWAVLRYLEDAPPAAAAVDRLLRRDRPVMSWVNLGEVFYVVRRARGEEEALAVVRDLRDHLDAELPTVDIVLAAGRIKSVHPMALADAYAAATAAANRATLWTGDPELLVPGAGWRWRDLRGVAGPRA